MVGSSSLGGIVIPIYVTRMGDKSTIPQLQSELSKLSSTIVQVNTGYAAQKTGLEGLNKQLNVLRWTYVNFFFIAQLAAGLAAPFVEATKAAMKY